MTEYSQEANERIEKLNTIKKAGIVPYAQDYKRTHNISEVLDAFEGNSNIKDSDDLTNDGAAGDYKIFGRLISFRSHGRISFGEIMDGSDKIQICFFRGVMKLDTGKEIVDQVDIDGKELSTEKFIKKFIDLGDFIGISGDLFVTNHGENTLFIDTIQLLSKAIRPLPEKFHGLSDQEKMYRYRYLDMISNPESYERIKLRSDFLKTLRKFYWKEGFDELETPILGNAASGAAAKPFKTYHNDFGQEFFLRISPETALKKATVGRFEKVFEIGKNFRNEGSDPSHIQEFTSIEHYSVGWNYKDNMEFTEKMFDYLFDNMDLDRKIKIQGKDTGDSKEIDFTTPWKRIDYVEGIKDVCGIDVSQYSMEDEDKLRSDIKDKDIHFENMDEMGTTSLIDYLFKKVLRPNILGPAFVYNYPKTMQPLARVSDEDENIVEQFQVVVNGWEIIKAYSELVDPQVQKANFQKQAEAIERGDEEATSSDDEFLEAMEYGMPPQSGWGMGVDRILALLTGQSNLRDLVLFPLMKPESGDDVSSDGE